MKTKKTVILLRVWGKLFAKTLLKQVDGSWGAPVNCGSQVNTVATETFPTVNEEGILYFSSRGFPGMGGYDIYRLKGGKSGWETPLQFLSLIFFQWFTYQ